VAEANEMIAGLLRWADRIESLEEPLREPNDRDLEALQRRAPFSLALDESLPQRPQPMALESIPVRRLVLKPGVLGGSRRALALARHALEAGREVVVTSLIESAAGVWASVQLAAASGSPLAHGLATSDWLASDLGAPPAIDAGRIPLAAMPGSGFQPYAERLRRSD
jgi:L-alanine-DL-glutamate epimerase-like enolase superfamily enzyme